MSRPSRTTPMVRVPPRRAMARRRSSSSRSVPAPARRDLRPASARERQADRRARRGLNGRPPRLRTGWKREDDGKEVEDGVTSLLLRDPFFASPFRLMDQLLRSTWSGNAVTGFTPLVDVRETDDEYLVMVDLPGVKAEDVSI